MCDFSFGRGRGYSRPRTPHPINTCVTPVYGRTTVFSVPHAALAAGLIEPPDTGALSWLALLATAKAKWGRSPDAFLRDATIAGVSIDSVRVAASVISPALIGWPRSAALKKDDNAFGLCPDLALTLAVLSHRAGNLIIRSREPDFSWALLFGGMFEVDGQIEKAPCLRSKPWSRFQWEGDSEVSHECTT